MMLSTAIKLLGTTIELGTRTSPEKPMDIDRTIASKNPDKNSHEMKTFDSKTNNDQGIGSDNTKALDENTDSKQDSTIPMDVTITDNNVKTTMTFISDTNQNVQTGNIDIATFPMKQEENTLTMSSLRIIYNGIDENFRLLHSHGKLLENIKQMDDKLTIFPENKEIKPYSNLDLLPNDEKSLKDRFQVLDNYSNRVIVYIDIGLVNL
jgi:hypothetical protein